MTHDSYYLHTILLINFYFILLTNLVTRIYTHFSFFVGKERHHVTFNDVIRRFGWGSYLSNYRGYPQALYADVNVFNYNYFNKLTLTLLWVGFKSAVENSNIALFILRGMVIMSPPL